MRVVIKGARKLSHKNFLLLLSYYRNIFRDKHNNQVSYIKGLLISGNVCNIFSILYLHFTKLHYEVGDIVENINVSVQS